MIAYLQDVNAVSITVRLLLATLFGGIIGYNRELHKKAAGSRTYMLISVGSALVMITNQYIFQTVASGVDPARMGAQVLSGIGFLGAGTILVIGRRNVSGLTTAAGLWTAAALGLACGIGFYLGAIIGGVFFIVIMIFMRRLDIFAGKHARGMDIYVELINLQYLKSFMEIIKCITQQPFEVFVERISDGGVGINITLETSEKQDQIQLIEELSQAEGVSFVQKIQ